MMISCLDEEGENVVIDDERNWRTAVERAIVLEEEGDLTVRIIASPKDDRFTLFQCLGCGGTF